MPCIFQQITDTLLSVVDFEIAYRDNILIKRESRDQNTKRVKEILKKTKQYDVKLIWNKSDFKSKIKNLG